jgi:hypothetical protein
MSSGMAVGTVADSTPDEKVASGWIPKIASCGESE